MKFIVDRTKWYRGKSENSSKLLFPGTQKMCCLGFVALQCGFTPKAIQGVATPGMISFEFVFDTPKYTKKQFPRGFRFLLGLDINGDWEDSKMSHRAMEINDDAALTDKQRERKLKELFKRAGHQIMFVN